MLTKTKTNMILKIILFALCANLLYTNANLMIAASSSLQGWQTVRKEELWAKIDKNESQTEA